MDVKVQSVILSTYEKKLFEDKFKKGYCKSNLQYSLEKYVLKPQKAEH